MTNLFFPCAIIVLIVILVIFIVLTNNIKIKDTNLIIEHELESKQKRNCDSEIIYAFEDATCNLMCANSILNKYIVKNGKCVNSNITESNAITDKCDPEKGVIAFLSGDTEFGNTNLLCLSIDPGIQPDNIEKANIYCVDGDIDINYLVRLPIKEDCICPETMFKAKIPATKTIREHYMCMDLKYKDWYELNNLNTENDTSV